MSLGGTANHASYDIIFVGGGAAACVTAGRLAAADPSLKILILEAGPHTYELHDHVQPARYFSKLIQESETFTLHTGKPSQALAGRSLVVPAGRCLGGGSSVNFAMYTRGAASDYNDWESVHGNSGWGSEHVIPLLKKAESYEPNAAGSRAVHGRDGPIHVSFAEEEVNVGSQFLEVALAYDKERGYTDDVNDFFSCNAYGRWPRYVDGKSGKRSDVPHNYIYSQPQNNNLKVLDRHRVVRVIFENKRAVGVEYVDDIVGRSKGEHKSSFVYASRLVVISAGTFGSPAILERSGIGAAGVMQRNDIPLLVDLPGVGEHYMDHNVIFSPYFASDDADTLDAIFRGDETALKPFVTRWLHDGKGLMSHNALDAGIKIRPNSADLKEIGPTFESRWRDYFVNALDKPVMWIGTLAAYAGKNPAAPRRKYFSMTYYTEYPVSVGRVHINSGLDAYAPLDFEPGFLNDPADVGVLRWAYKKGREISRRMNIYRGEFEPGHPRYPEGSKACCTISDGPVDILSPDITYSAEDDKAIDEYHRETIETSWHSMGTCAMKARDAGGVVDARLNVYGVQNLKVADCSISPGNVGANTYNTALAIGEKAAVIIAEELGIKGVSAG